jgi:hypothetical protein
MISVKYLGRTGNQLFQYVMARILAEKTGMSMKCQPITGFNISNNLQGLTLQGDRLTLKRHVIDIESAVIHKGPIHLEGYFQRSSYYIPYRKKIIGEWIDVSKNIKELFGHVVKTKLFSMPSESDLCMHIRLGDYHSHGYTISFDHYVKMIDAFDYDRLWIFTDSPNDRFLTQFSYLKPTVISSNNHVLDWYFFSKFRNMIISQSSYSWWAAFFSNANRVVYPITSDSGAWGLNNKPEINLVEGMSQFGYEGISI